MEESRNEQHYEKVLARFANPIDSDEEDEEVDSQDKWNEDERTDMLAALSTTKELRYEFKVAYELVAGDNKYISRVQVFDLMLAMGYTFQETDVDELLDGCITANDSDYAVETLLEAFERWYGKQLKVSEVKALYLMFTRDRKKGSSPAPGRVVQEHIILPDFPEKNLDAKYEQIKDAGPITHSQLKDALNQILNKSGHEADSVTDEEVTSLLKEIASLSRKKITFEEFIGLFKVYY